MKGTQCSSEKVCVQVILSSGVSSSFNFCPLRKGTYPPYCSTLEPLRNIDSRCYLKRCFSASRDQKKKTICPPFTLRKELETGKDRLLVFLQSQDTP